MNGSSWTSSSNATRRSPDKSTLWNCWAGPDVSKCLSGSESFNRQTLLAAHKGQNRPETYRGHRPPLPRARIQFPFLQYYRGFRRTPSWKFTSIWKSFARWQPTWASFYILCPIPGTEQYDDFLAQGLITETNLDRFDSDVPDVAASSPFSQTDDGTPVPMLSQILLSPTRPEECAG